MKINDKIYRYCEDLSLILIFYCFKEEFEKYYTNFKIHYDYIERDFIIDNKIVSSFKRFEYFSKIFNLDLKGLIDNDLLKESNENKSGLIFFDEEIILEILFKYIKNLKYIKKYEKYYKEKNIFPVSEFFSDFGNFEILEKFKNNIKDLNNNYQLFLIKSFEKLLIHISMGLFDFEKFINNIKEDLE